MEMVASGQDSRLWAPCTWMGVGGCGVRACGAGQLVRAHIRDKALLCVWGAQPQALSALLSLIMIRVAPRQGIGDIISLFQD